MIVALRKLRMSGAEIALCLALSTVSALLARVGLGKLSRLEPPNRYQCRHAGELLHVDERIRPCAGGHRARRRRDAQLELRAALGSEQRCQARLECMAW